MARGCYNPEDNYLPASFKGIPFEALDASSEHGRRGAEGEFPWGEETGYVDLGRRIRNYSVSGRFADNNHVTMAAALIAAVESIGPGVLVHPTRGVLFVACKSLRINDNRNQQAGVTTFDMEFVEANILGSGMSFGLGIVNLAISSIIGAIGASFNDHYDPENVRWYQSGASLSTMKEAIGKLGQQYNGSVSDNNESKWDLVSDFNVIENDPYILKNPETAFKVIKNAFFYIDRDAASPGSKVIAFQNTISWANQSSSLSGEAAETQDATFSSLRMMSYVYLAKAYLETEPETFSEGISQYDKITRLFLSEMERINKDCDDPSLYLETEKFLQDAQRALLQRAYKSPALVEYSFPGSVDSLIAAYEIFGDAKRFREIESRNAGYPWNLGPDIVAPRI